MHGLRLCDVMCVCKMSDDVVSAAVEVASADNYLRHYIVDDSSSDTERSPLLSHGEFQTLSLLCEYATTGRYCKYKLVKMSYWF